MVDESYPEGEDGVWHHVRIECLKPEPEMTGDHIRFTMDDREWTFTIPEFLPEQVKVMIASRSVRMVNAFDNIVYHRAQKRQIIVSWADVKTMFR